MIQRALVLADGRDLTLDHFPALGESTSVSAVRRVIRQSETEELRAILFKHGGNFTRAARALGIPRTTLVSRAKKTHLA
ncbi:MAG: helix-turn-helix domain-containing protein [Polyangiaceae bacterium]